MQATVSITVPADHPHLRQILDLIQQRAAPTAPSRAEILDRLLAADLNDGEQAFLVRLAEASPATVAYEDLVELAGSPQKLGNITSGLVRRWKSRGGADDGTPWTDVPNEGRQMSKADAEVVRARLSKGT